MTSRQEYSEAVLKSFPAAKGTRMLDVIVQYHEKIGGVTLLEDMRNLERENKTSQLSTADQIDVLSQIILSLMVGYARGVVDNDPKSKGTKIHKTILTYSDIVFYRAG